MLIKSAVMLASSETKIRFHIYTEANSMKNFTQHLELFFKQTLDSRFDFIVRQTEFPGDVGDTIGPWLKKFFFQAISLFYLPN